VVQTGFCAVLKFFRGRIRWMKKPGWIEIPKELMHEMKRILHFSTEI